MQPSGHVRGEVLSKTKVALESALYARQMLLECLRTIGIGQADDINLAYKTATELVQTLDIIQAERRRV